MVRTQIYIPAETHRELRQEAADHGISLTELVRRICSEHLDGRRGVSAFRKEAVMRFVALGSSGHADTSEAVDEALAEAFRAQAVR